MWQQLTDKIHAAVDARGNPLTFIVTPGQSGDCPQAKALLQPYEKESVTAVLMGRGYDNQELVGYIEGWNAKAVIPSRKSCKVSRTIRSGALQGSPQGRVFFRSYQAFSLGGYVLREDGA